MKAWHRLGLLGMSLLWPAMCWTEDGKSGVGESSWLTDYSQARTLAREKDKPILAVFR